MQTDGANGRFVLSDNWEPIEIGKNLLLVTDPFHLELNGKKQTSALAKRLNALAMSEHHIQSTLELQDQINRWIMELEEDLPYVTVHNDSLDIGTVLKAAGIRFDETAEKLEEKICSLIKISAEYLNIKLLALVGIHTVLGNESIREIYKTAIYEKISIMDIERYRPESLLDCETPYIIDRDLCEIYNDLDNDSL